MCVSELWSLCLASLLLLSCSPSQSSNPQDDAVEKNRDAAEVLAKALDYHGEAPAKALLLQKQTINFDSTGAADTINERLLVSFLSDSSLEDCENLRPSAGAWFAATLPYRLADESVQLEFISDSVLRAFYPDVPVDERDSFVHRFEPISGRHIGYDVHHPSGRSYRIANLAFQRVGKQMLPSLRTSHRLRNGSPVALRASYAYEWLDLSHPISQYCR